MAVIVPHLQRIRKHGVAAMVLGLIHRKQVSSYHFTVMVRVSRILKNTLDRVSRVSKQG